MPFFVVPLFIGMAAAAGTAGVGMAAKGSLDQHTANQLNDNSGARIRWAANNLEKLRGQCSDSLNALGKEKVIILDGSVQRFLDAFQQLKNVDFTASEGLDELNKLRIDKAASTGTAISALSGVAASNATLAFFGGGSLAAGGLGMAGGAAVLGGLVAGPALLVMGVIIGAKGGKNLEEAKTQSAEASKYCEQMMAGADQCVAIRRRSYMFHALLARLDAKFLPSILEMENIIKTEGTDYSQFRQESKKTIAAAASTAASIKAVLDTPLLAEDGSLTLESEKLMKNSGI